MVHKIILDEIEFTVKPITRAELREIMDDYEDEWAQEDELVRRCVMSPTDIDLDMCPAGVISELAQRIIDVSGLGDDNIQAEMFAGAREEARTADRAFDLMIMMGLGISSIDELEAMPMDRWMLLAAMAERALVEFYGIPPDTIASFIKGEPPKPEKPVQQIPQMPQNSAIRRK